MKDKAAFSKGEIELDKDKIRSLNFDELRVLYKEYLQNLDISTLTISTAYSDTFYLWRKGSKELFWSTVTATDFENVARLELLKALYENSKGNINSLVSSYLSHLRRFCRFLSLETKKTSVKYKQEHKLEVHPTKKNREIILNKMYVGAYLSEGDNIGHEIINLYKADDGKNYIYLNSQGTIELSHSENEITVLLVRKFASKIYKILAKAEGVAILDFADSRLAREERYNGQVQLGLTYGAVRLVDLFIENLYHGSLQEEKNAYTTFVVDQVIKPKHQILITDDSSISGDNIFFIRTNKGFGKQTLREFFREDEKPNPFTDLSKIIRNEALWENANTTQFVSELTEPQADPYFNFLRIIKQEDNELAFSNMFAHFFYKSREAFSLFSNQVLHVQMKTDFTIEREKRNIDLLISDEDNVIVIENKIKSSINGIDDRYDIYSDQVQSQLNKYYHYVTTDDEYCKKAAFCFIFSPNYNRIELSKFSCGEKYTIIYYREIYNFFVENRSLFDQEPYVDDFLKAMHKHTKDYDNDLEEEMQRRFLNTIYKAKARKKML